MNALFYDALFYDALFLGALFLGALFLEPPKFSKQMVSMYILKVYILQLFLLSLGVIGIPIPESTMFAHINERNYSNNIFAENSGYDEYYYEMNEDINQKENFDTIKSNSSEGLSSPINSKVT